MCIYVIYKGIKLQYKKMKNNNNNNDNTQNKTKSNKATNYIYILL